ncbi:MAG: dehydrogenase [Bacteroidales bacterium]|nr:dehydrogenase [Bacteroidales bacterium]
MKNFAPYAAAMMILAVGTCAQYSGCGHQSLPVSDTPHQDSLIVELPQPPKTLPDTVFSSVLDNIEYEVITIDTTISGELGSTDNLYGNIKGVLTFRGNPWRRANFGGKVTGTPSEVVQEWVLLTAMDNTTTKFGTWGGGNGWTGQPLHIYWPDSVFNRIKAENKELTKDFQQHEVIVGSLCSKVYFINPDNGKPSRNPIDVGNPIKGTISLDPAMNGRLYVGHGVPNRQPFGHITVDVFTNKVIHTYGGDSKAWRSWNAYDSSPIRVGDFVFRPGENGILYKYYAAGDDERLHSKMRFRRKGRSGAEGMESSMSVYKNYGYFCDNGGNILCVNLETLCPVWHFDNKDDSDASIVIDEEDGVPYLYSGCEVDKQGAGGKARFVKLNGLNGELVWLYDKVSSRHNDPSGKHFDGGFYATPLLGEGNCDSLVFVNRVDNEGALQNGHFIALHKKTGRLVYEHKLSCYSWSSPVGFLNENGEQFVLTGDTQGRIYLFNGIDGSEIFKKVIGLNFEASPLVIGNQVIIGSRGNQIFGLRVQ